MSGYYFFLGYLPLPITPAALSISTPSMNKTLTLVNEGEINIPKKAGLREISFDFLLPQVTKYPFSHYQIDKYTATLWREYIKLIKEANVPFHFIVVRMTPKGGLTGVLGFTCIKCVIEDFTFDEDADSLGLDVQCSIKLKEYRDYGTKRITLEEAREKYGKTYMQGHSASTQPKQATVTKTRSAVGKVVKPQTTIKQGETVATATKRATGTLPSASDMTESLYDTSSGLPTNVILDGSVGTNIPTPSATSMTHTTNTIKMFGVSITQKFGEVLQQCGGINMSGSAGGFINL